MQEDQAYTIIVRMSSSCQGKSSWPELVGAQGKTAEATIERENPLVNAQIVKEGSSVILNFDCTRVWVWVDKDGVVTRVPIIG
ncbi:glu S.griseus protease inhibitor-like [Rhododendron vialii]|uniref:glu S.griseus protease inhibitor-like n=1 Tax=Rhododendron vialii TaxID=182163 RepID=UPI00265F2178|nr:glu S.griseus protease inhibitor-like [Rhododendron vialii]